jgi:hypothetical protein
MSITIIIVLYDGGHMRIHQGIILLNLDLQSTSNYVPYSYAFCLRSATQFCLLAGTRFINTIIVASQFVKIDVLRTCNN